MSEEVFVPATEARKALGMSRKDFQALVTKRRVVLTNINGTRCVHANQLIGLRFNRPFSKEDVALLKPHMLKQHSHDDEWLSSKAAAEVFDLDVATIHNWRRKGIIRAQMTVKDSPVFCRADIAAAVSRKGKSDEPQPE